MTQFSICSIDPSFSSSLFPEGETNALSLSNLLAKSSFDDIDAIFVGNLGVDALAVLRAHPQLAPLPIYEHQSTQARHPLSDGPFPENPVAELAAVREKSAQFDLASLPSPDQTVLAYLDLIQDRKLSPVSDLSTSGIYGYPLLDALGIQDARAWIVRAEREGLIQQDRIIDRTRHCSSCGGAHLNYIDQCPNCKSLEIKHQQAIHCFTCGHVNDQELFLRGERLVCPKCATALKHIGADYDRPIERHICDDCGERFNSPDVNVACFECSTVNAQNDLSVHTHAAYRIGPSGRNALLKRYNPDAEVAQFGDAVARPHFLWTLAWLNELSLNNTKQAVIALVQINGLEGVGDAAREALALRVTTLLTPSEIVHFYGNDRILILLPDQGSKRLQALVKQLQNMSAENIEGNVDLKIDGAPLPIDEIREDAAGWLDAYATQGTP